MEPKAIVEELIPAPEATAVFQQLRHWPHCIFLDSARRDPELGRYSFVAADPFGWIVGRQAEAMEALTRVTQLLRCSTTATLPDLPPFQGGAAGFLAYDLGRVFEPSVAAHRFDDLETPTLAMGLYDVVCSFDHVRGRAWLISQGFPETDPIRRRERAAERMQTFLNRINANVRSPAQDTGPAQRVVLQAPHLPSRRDSRLMSDFTEKQYLSAVERTIEYIHAGDIFQANIAQRLVCAAIDDAAQLYLRLRTENAAPFAGYFDLGMAQIVSASPERFMRVRERTIETRPIKGTRPRRPESPEASLFSGMELRESVKDRSENIMIVDLLRNDLSRICDAHSIRVPQLCHVETYAFVQHLVSAVTGRLRPSIELPDILRATFPGGSITGAPKVRAMQIIAELEHATRGPYCGALGYVSSDGASDWNLLIRTITAARGWWHFPVGGGIVADSVPQRELEETWHKAEGLLRSLDPRRVPAETR